MNSLKELNISHCMVKELRRRVSGVVLAICELQFFSSWVSQRLKDKGLRIVWPNEMMGESKGKAAKAV